MAVVQAITCVGCAREVPAFRQQGTKVERSVQVAVLVGTPVGGLSRTQVTSFLEQHAEIERALGIAGIIGAGM
ncbi:MAG TPA: hypothetical protein VMP89_11555, partial [Solirubrobacteraceae bacterium]|nr:hypothetical protein [Solirubrobacteraceae bacterium]